MPQGAHLVGSVPLPDAEQVFRAAASALAGHLRRVPDGETGERSMWAAFQVPRLAQNPAFQVKGARVLDAMLRGYARSRLVRRGVNFMVGRALQAGRGQGATLVRLRPGVRAEDVRLGPLGYASAALASYRVFSRLKAAGALPAAWRFQVCLPTPIAVISSFPLAQQHTLLTIYEAGLVDEIRAMLAHIPAAELAIQWDAAIEFALLEGVVPSPYGAPAASRQPLLDALVRVGQAVPADVELGYHLCYGDAGHKHFKEPSDTSKMVDTANFLAAGVQRRLHWLHFPVPVERADDAYFAALRDLHLAAETEVYVGLVHQPDTADGAQRRIAAAERALGRPFGVATECGLGRRDPRTIPTLLAWHARLAEPFREPARV